MKKTNSAVKASSPIACCGLGLIQCVVLCICFGQMFLIGYLMMNHNVFQTSLSDISEMTRNLIQKQPNIEGINLPSSLYNQRNTPRQIEYSNFPVMVKTVGHIDFIPSESKSAVQSLVGTVLDVNFPDLTYRHKESVRSQYTRIFEELPAYGFLQEFKNPCWRDDGDKLQCLPYAYVLGQPKCGTSDLFERLKAHQDIM